MNNTSSFQKFRTVACTVLGGVTGGLIGIPCAAVTASNFGTVIVVLFFLMGARIGYQKRESSFFFYFSIISTLLLASLITRSGIPQ